jgi:hypothetical protein
VPAAYLLGGAILTAASLAAIGYGRTHAQVLDISRPQVAASRHEGLDRTARGALSSPSGHGPGHSPPATAPWPRPRTGRGTGRG